MWVSPFKIFNFPLDFCLNRCYILFIQKKGDDKLSPRTGRPTNNPKENYTGIRLSDDELKKLKFCMEKTGMTKTGVIRAGIELVYEQITKK